MEDMRRMKKETEPGYFWKRPFPHLLPEKMGGKSLQKVLGPADLILMGLGATMGTGIFVISGVATTVAGPGVVVSFILAGICCLFVAFCYAELASVIPVVGSAYSYSYIIFGELVAWMIGWVMIMDVILAVAIVATGWSQYFSSVMQNIGDPLPLLISQDPLSGGLVDLPALVMISLMVILLIAGTRESARVNIVMVIVKLCVLFIFFWFGFHAIHITNFTPFFSTGISGVMTSASLIIISYLGFEYIATSAEEVKNPRRDLSLALIGTIFVCTVLYVLTGIVLTGVLPYTAYENVAAPITYALDHAGLAHAGVIVGAGVIIGITSGLLITIYGASRLIFAISRDGLIPPWFSHISERGTPLRATLAVGIAGGILAGFVPIEILADFISMGTLCAFICVAAGVLVLRRIAPDLSRPFRCPLIPFLPVVAIISCLLLITSLQTITHIGFLVWILIGLGIYRYYGKTHALREGV